MECFNFVRYDGNDVVMLAKYNLNVGDKAKGSATNLQDSDVIGFSLATLDTYGEVAFSANNYWYDSSNNILKPKYGNTWNTNNIYDKSLVTAPDFTNDGYETDGYSIAYYVENYKAILDSYGVNLKDARLLTYSEVVNNNIGCDYTNHTCLNTFVADTSFWLGSGHDCGVGVLFITSTGSFDDITNVYD